LKSFEDEIRNPKNVGEVTTRGILLEWGRNKTRGGRVRTTNDQGTKNKEIKDDSGIPKR